MLLSCFKNQSFRYLWTAGCFTGIARAMEFLTLSLYILNDFGLAYLITVIFAFRMLPMSMLGLIIGSISEKISPILIVRFLYSLSFSFTLICVFLKNFDYFNLFFALLLAFINGTTWVIDLAVRRRIITENITEKLLSTSLAMETLSNNSTRLIGPLLAGFLYVAIDLEGLLLIISSLYFLALSLIICFEKISKNSNASSTLQKNIVYEFISVFKSLKNIIFNAFKDINLKLLLIVTLVFNLFGFPLISLIPVYGKNILNLSEYLNKKPEDLTACILDRPRHTKIINELNDLNVNIKLITDGDICGALLVTDEKYNVDIFLGTGGGPEGVLAAAALDAFDCSFQGRFLFKTDEDKNRANKMGIKDFSKKYELNEIISGDSIFCATGITTGDLVSGIKIKSNQFISETLVTHKSSGMKKVIKLKQNL